MVSVGNFILYIVFLLSFTLGAMMFGNRASLRPRQRLLQCLFSCGAVALCAGLACLPSGAYAVERLIYAALTVYSTVWIFATFQVGWRRFVYNYCSGYLVSLAYYRICSMLVFLGGWSDQHQPQNILPMLLVRIMIFAVLYPALHFLLARRIAADEKFELHPLVTVLMALLTGMVFSYFGEVGTALRQQGAMEYIRICCMQAAFSIVMLAFIYAMWSDAHRLAQERAEAEIHRVRVEQLQVLNDVITDVNIRIHDLKHQLAQPTQNTAMQELAESIKGYDAFVFTGDDELDMILTSKNVQCIANGITAFFSVDGKALSMLSATEKASLFGNAIDNAIAGLQDVDAEHRFLTISCNEDKGMVCLIFRNYFDGKAQFNDAGLPKTTNEDKAHHGFGTQSIRKIAQDHNGVASFKAENNSFTVSVVLPAAEPVIPPK